MLLGAGTFRQCKKVEQSAAVVYNPLGTVRSVQGAQPSAAYGLEPLAKDTRGSHTAEHPDTWGV